MALSLAANLVPAGVAFSATKQVSYICDAAGQNEHLFHVEVGVSVEDEVRVQFQLPAWNALYQIQDFAQRVRRVKAFNQDRSPLPVEKVDKDTWEVSTQGATEVKFSYDIYANILSPYDSQLNAHHGFLNPASVFMYPVGRKALPIEVRFQIPEEWHIATELLPSGAKNTYLARNYDHFADSPVEMGTFRWLQFEAKGTPFAVIVDGESAQFDDQEMLQLLKRIVETEIELMQDIPFTHYTFIYHFPNERSGGGMEHAYSSAIQVNAQEVSRRLDDIAGVTAHEFFHLWNVKRIRPASLEPIDYTKENYTRALWFSEGVTNLYGAYTLVRSGIQTKDEFLQSLAQVIQEEQTRLAHLFQSAEDASLDTWFDKYAFYRRPENSISYYEKGEILGFLLDLSIRQETQNRRSLDDVLRLLNREYAQRGIFFDERRSIPDAIEQVAGKAFEDFFQRFVRGADEVDYNSFLTFAGLRLEIQSRQVADPGFTVTLNKKGALVVDEVAEGSAAEKAGMKGGDELVQVNGRRASQTTVSSLSRMDPGKRIKLKVRGEGGSVERSFYMGSKNVVQYAIAESPEPSALQAAIRSSLFTGK